MAASTAELEAIVVRLVGDASDYIKALQLSMDQTEKFANKVESEVTRAINSFKGLSEAIITPLKALGDTAVEEFSKFNDAMTKSTVALGNMAEEDRRHLEQVTLQLSLTARQGPEELAKAYYYLISAGLDAKQSMEAIPVVSRFATAGVMEMDHATQSLVTTFNALGYKTTDAAENLAQMERVTNVLVKGSKLSLTTVQQLTDALTNQGAAAAKAYGISLENAVANLMTLSDQSIKGATAGQTYARALRIIADVAGRNGDAFKEVGIKVFDSGGNLKDLSDIVGDLTKQFATMSPRTRALALNFLGFETRVQTAILPLLKTTQATKDYAKELKKGGDYSKDVAELQMKSFAAQMKILGNYVSVAAIEIGRVLAPSINQLGGAVKSVVSWFIRLNDQSKAFIVNILGVISVAAGIAASLGIIKAAFTILFSGMGTIPGILFGILTTIGLVVVYFKTFGGDLTGLFNSVKDRLGGIWEAITNVAGKFWDYIGSDITKFAAGFIIALVLITKALLSIRISLDQVIYSLISLINASGGIINITRFFEFMYSVIRRTFGLLANLVSVLDGASTSAFGFSKALVVISNALIGLPLSFDLVFLVINKVRSALSKFFQGFTGVAKYGNLFSMLGNMLKQCAILTNIVVKEMLGLRYVAPIVVGITKGIGYLLELLTKIPVVGFLFKTLLDPLSVLTDFNLFSSIGKIIDNVDKLAFGLGTLVASFLTVYGVVRTAVVIFSLLKVVLSALGILQALSIAKWVVWNTLVITAQSVMALYNVQLALWSTLLGLGSIYTGVATAAVTLFNGALLAMQALLAPEVLIAIGVTVAAVAAAFIVLGSAVYAGYKTVDDLIKILSNIPGIEGPINAIIGVFEGWQQVIQGIVTAMKNDIPFALTIAQAYFELVVLRVGNLWNPLWKFITEGFTAVWEFVSNKFYIEFLNAIVKTMGFMATLPAAVLKFFGITDVDKVVTEATDAATAELKTLGEATTKSLALSAKGFSREFKTTTPEIKRAEEALGELLDIARAMGDTDSVKMYEKKLKELADSAYDDGKESGNRFAAGFREGAKPDNLLVFSAAGRRQFEDYLNFLQSLGHESSKGGHATKKALFEAGKKADEESAKMKKDGAGKKRIEVMGGWEERPEYSDLPPTDMPKLPGSEVKGYEFGGNKSAKDSYDKFMEIYNKIKNESKMVETEADLVRRGLGDANLSYEDFCKEILNRSKITADKLNGIPINIPKEINFGTTPSSPVPNQPISNPLGTNSTESKTIISSNDYMEKSLGYLYDTRNLLLKFATETIYNDLELIRVVESIGQQVINSIDKLQYKNTVTPDSSRKIVESKGTKLPDKNSDQVTQLLNAIIQNTATNCSLTKDSITLFQEIRDESRDHGKYIYSSYDELRTIAQSSQEEVKASEGNGEILIDIVNELQNINANIGIDLGPAGV